MRADVTLAGSRWSIGPARFSDPVEVIEARVVGEVADALRRVDRAALGGNWVAGVVAYEAAPGLDARLSTSTYAEGPLVWFGVYRECQTNPVLDETPVRLTGWSSAMSREQHTLAVAGIRESIRRGDTYQANLTFPMSSGFEGTASGLFRTMLATQPDSFGAIVDLGDKQIVSVSPESFLRVAGRSVESRPMKGTAPRGRWPAEDARIRTSLADSEKERAANLMIVDLIRNDLGRVCEFGSIDVPDLFSIERHPTVWQMTSTVAGRLRDDVDLLQLLTACFPSGSVTGAPKPSTTSIITAHEVGARGPYCGAIGFIEPGGRNAEFSVAIRTGIVAGDRFTYHVGGGITWESTAEAEYDECLWKALAVTEPVRRPDLIETMRYEPGVGIALLERHVARLASSADYWGIPLDLGSIGESLSALGAPRPVKVRLILFADGNVDIETEPFDDEPGSVTIRVSETRVDQASPAWYHKTLDRSRYPDPVDHEELLVNLDGQVTETNRSNVFASVDGRWVTPPIDAGLLPGVLREQVLERGEAVEADLSIDDLRRADEIAVTNAVRGWRKARLIE